MHCNNAVETLHRIELGQHEAINKTAVSLSLSAKYANGWNHKNDIGLV